MTFLDFVWRAIVALVLGVVVGIERNTRVKEAGIRTHGIVSLAACVFMMISQFAIEGVAFDGSRIASQIIPGIGFLGVGIIYNRRGTMQGLTTAAGVWATAAIGMCCGSSNIWFVLLAVVVTVIIVIFQLIFHKPIKFLSHKTETNIKVKFIKDKGYFTDNLKKHGKIVGYSIKKENEEVMCSCTISILGAKEVDSIVDKIYEESESIKSVEVVNLS